MRLGTSTPAVPVLPAAYSALLRGFAQWLGVRGYAARSVKSRVQYARGLLVWLDGRALTASVPAAYLQYLEARPGLRGGGLSAAHINAAISSINVLWRYLRACGQTASSVRLARLAPEAKAYEILGRADIRELLAAARSGAQGLRDRALIAVLYGAGLRVSEASGLNLADVDTRYGLLRVERGKGGAVRVVPLTDAAVADLAAWLSEGRPWYRSRACSCPESFFLNIRGGRLGIDGIAARLRNLAAAAGIARPVTPHSLRHAIATHLLEAGMDIERIAAFLGHRSLASTQVYTHIVAGRDAEV